MMSQKQLKYIKAELQSLGVRIDNISFKKGGAGPAEGDTIILNDTVTATVPAGSDFVKESPFEIKTDKSKYLLVKNGERICDVSFPQRPEFYSKNTADGTPCWKIALRHGTDCFATTVFQKCIYWNTTKRCRFCGIELSLKSGQTVQIKTPDQLAETASYAHDLDGLKYATLTTGTGTSNRDDIQHLCNCISEIKKRVEMPVHVQIEPAGTIESITALRDAGADTIGIHIESFDQEILKYTAPAKAEYGLERYILFWKKAVSIFGKNQVSSFIIAGLGEKIESIISGCKILSEIGVYPYIIPLRPIPGSLMQDTRPPEPNIMIEIYESGSEILNRSGLSSKKSLAGCVRCGACSAVTDFE